MMAKVKNSGEHCPEVRKIMEKKPGWIIRWGTLLITVAVVISIILWWRLFS
ncbi:MAG TPA: hypothetical protein PLW67_12080 [Prolixibacteraceae bacterium]|nr:hypothetical protein [Prolixibacteraceae bacterium]